MSIEVSKQTTGTPTWAEIHADKIELANKLHAANDGIEPLVSCYGVHVGSYLAGRVREFVTREFPDATIERTGLHGETAFYQATCNGIHLSWSQVVRVTVDED